MNHWNPIRRSDFPQSNRRPPPAKPKVVSIPVHFVGSDGHGRKQAAAAAGTTVADRSAAAIKIQKVFRGYLVRKSVKTVRRIAAEAEEIARRIGADEGAIRRDAKERLRVGEMLMSLLLRLDSVRGVREYRRKAIGRVISLQEAVDSIPVSSETPPVPKGSQIDAETLETGDRIQLVPDASIEAEEEPVLSANPMEEAPETEEAMGESAVEAVSMDREALETPESTADQMEVAPELAPPASRAVGESLEDERKGGERGDEMERASMKEVIERVAAESERLKGLVAELCEGNAQQCRLMSRLVERVEQLEQKVQRMERTKKKKRCGGQKQQ